MDSSEVIEQVLCTVASKVLKKDVVQIDGDKSFTEQGGSALSSIFMAGQCRAAGILLDVTDFSNKANSLRSLAKKAFSATNPSAGQAVEEKVQKQPSSASLSEIQSLYFANGLHQALIQDVEQELTKADAIEHLNSLGARHAVLHSSFEAQANGTWLLQEKAATLAHDAVSLVSFVSDERCISRVRQMQQELSEAQSGSRRVLTVMLFGEVSRIRKMALVAPAAALDAHSWHVIAQELTSSFNHQPLHQEEKHSFFDWLGQKAENSHVDQVENLGLSPDGQARLEDAITTADEAASSQCTKVATTVSGTATLSSDHTGLLMSDACHENLRSEALDVILASVALVLHASQQVGELLYFEARNGRPQVDDHKDSWNSVVGCFDQSAVLPYQVYRAGDAFDVVRRAKDARRQCRSLVAASTKVQSNGLKRAVFDATGLRRAARSDVKILDPRQDVGHAIVQTFGDIHVLPTWSPHGNLNVTIVIRNDLISATELEVIVQALKRQMELLVIELTDGVEHPPACTPCLHDFPHLMLNYPSLDYLFTGKLQNIVSDPLRDIEVATPCSPVQDNILQATAQDAAAYICTFKVRISSGDRSAPCDAATCASAWKAVIARHAALRTVFVESAERPGHFDQFVLKSIEARIDLTSLSSDAVNASQPLTSFHPLEVPHQLTIVQESPTQCLLALTVSHAIVDGHSAEVIFSDVCRNIAEGGIHHSLAEPALSFSDYVLAQHPSRVLSPSEVTQKSAYWTKYLQKTQETHLPVARSANSLNGFKTMNSIVPVNVKSVDRLCQQNGVNLSSLCQLAWGVVLKTLIGTDKVCFSTIAATRNVPLAGIMTAVGPLITTLLCSTDLDDATNVLDALKTVHIDYQASLLHEAEISTVVSTRRWSNTVMSLRRRLVQNDESLTAVSCKVIQGLSPTNYDVSLIVSAGQSEMDVSLDYWSSRMDDYHARTLLRTFEKVLQSILENLHASISDLELLNDADERRLLQRNREVPKGLQQCVHELIDTRIQNLKTSTIAVNAWDGSLTYDELRRKADLLSRQLVSMGAGPEIPIGLCMTKSKSVPIAMLAILMSGSAVLPIGVQEPLARIEAILADSSPALVLCNERQQIRLGNMKVALLDVDEAMIGCDQSTSHTKELRGKANNVCWIFYTSGSTGKPKGVLIEHGAMATSLCAHGDAINWSENTRIFQFSAHTFDASVLEICTTLVYGGCVCIPSDSDRLNDLEGSIRRLEVNTLALTSSAAALIRPMMLPLVKKLMLFGEAVKKAVVDSWYGQADVYNSYGPTETSILVSAGKPIQNLDDFSNIGQALNVNLWVADVKNPGKLVPIGAPGELLVEGPLLARGYLNDTIKTDAAFIVDPDFSCRMFGDGVGRRFYRTGDVVRQNEDLSMSYVGRRDKQVKVRGQRLEVAEVEHWIVKTMRGAKRAVVGLLPVIDCKEGASPLSAPGGDVLFAAIELLPGDAGCGLYTTDLGSRNMLPASASLQEALCLLRDALLDRLPSYMVPTFFVPFQHIPLTANSKTDWKDILALMKDLDREDLRKYLANDAESDEASENSPAVISNTARQLSGLWGEVLGRNGASLRARDHFLHQGGDSVAAIRLVEMARRKGILTHMTVADVMSAPRLGQLAQLLDERADSENAETSCFLRTEVSHGVPAPFSLWTPYDIHSKKEDLADIAQQCGLDVDDIQDVYPCTSLQKTMFAATQQRATAYVFRQTYSLSPSIDLERFQSAWDLLIEAVPVLRTRILLGHRSGTALQILCKKGNPWEQSDSLDSYLQKDKERAMSNGKPLIRLALVHGSQSGNDHFVWTAHHSAYDGWSVQLIFRQLASLYSNDEKPTIVPFTGFIKHILDLHTETDDAASFWRGQMQGDVPTSFPTLPSSDYKPDPRDTLHFELRLPAKDYLKEAEGHSMANILRAAWAMTLSQYLDASRVLFGATLSGRNAPVPRVTDLVAPTLTTVPIRIQLDPGQTVSEFLEQVQTQAVEMIPFEHTGLEDIKRLVSDSHISTSLNHVLIIQPTSMSSGPEPRIPITGLNLINTMVEAFDTFALSVQCDLPANDSVGCFSKVEVRFDGRVLQASQISVLLRQFEHWTCQFLDQTLRDHKIRDLDCITATDLTRIREINATAPTKREAFVHQLIENVALEQPDAIAVHGWDGGFTYEDLVGRSRGLAQHLIDMGVGPDFRVGICMEKSKWSAVSILGILEAGGVLVFLNTLESLDRLRSTIEDCGAQVLITDEVHKSRLSALGVPLIVPNDVSSADSAQRPTKGSQLRPELRPSHPAWIVYSSGSTGTPKGSLHLHSSLATSLLAHGEATGWSKSSRVLQFAAHTFDAALQEILTTLVFGGCVCIPSEAQRMDALTQTIRDYSITHLILTFSVAGIVNPHEVPSVQQLIVVGEQAKLGVIDRWLGHAEILNMYGPSECVICVSRSVPMQRIEDGPNIGWPLKGCRFWVVSISDPNQLCPIGVSGELLIESAWQAREYVKRPELTAKAFLQRPDFLGKLGLGTAGRRMYRSGDLVRQNSDGSYTHLGRIGSEVKFHGQKVQVNEIEDWIGKLLAEVIAVTVDVIDFSAGQGSSELLAVVELRTEESAFSEPEEVQTEHRGDILPLPPSLKLQRILRDLKDALAEKLPSHLVPTAYLPVEKIPLTSSGKTDRSTVRRAVSSLKLNSAVLRRYLAVETHKEAPTTAIGMQLRQLWSQVLSVRVDTIGIHDHFTRLGGDSLAAMNLASAGQQSGISLTVAMIMTHPVLADQVLALENTQQAANGMTPKRPDTVPFELFLDSIPNTPEPSATVSAKNNWSFQARLADIATQCHTNIEQIQDVYPCTSMQEALFAISAKQPATYTFRQVFKIGSDVLDVAKFQEAWEQVAQALDILRTRIVVGYDGRFYQAVVRAALQWYTGEHLTLYINDDRSKNFDLGQPLLRCAIIQTANSGNGDDSYFVLTAHHSMFDRFSLERVFYQYVLPVYAGQSMPNIVPYTRFIRYVLETDLERAAGYWKQQLAAGEASTDFPLQYSSIQSEGSQPRIASLITRSFNRRTANDHETSFANILRAAWALTIAQYVASDDVMFAVNLSGRSAPVAGITEIAAPTFTTVPVRVKVDRTRTVQEFLREVHDNSVNMIPYEHVGLKKIQELVPDFSPADLKHLFLVHPAVSADTSDPSTRLEGLEKIEIDSQATLDYPLEVMCKVDERRGGKVVVEARFDTNLIQQDQMRSILVQFEHNISQLNVAAAEAQSSQTIGELPMVSSEDLDRILAWNGRLHSSQVDSLECVHETFRKSAEEHPEDTAIDSWDGQLTYRELDQFAVSLAQVLRTNKDVRPEVPVGLAMAKSRWAVVAMLAILYAGGAVVPLGIQMPHDRTKAILEDCKPAVIICDEIQASRFMAAGPNMNILTVDQNMLSQLQHTIRQSDDAIPVDLVRSHNMAWIMYTSGSTGVPKGVVLEHKSIASSILGHGNVCQFDSPLRAFQFSAYSFDVSISDIFVTLSKGGTVCIPSEEERLNDLVGAIQRSRANALHLTASTAALLPPDQVPDVKTLALGGEHINPSLLEKWLKLSKATIINSYGPVECSIASTAKLPLADPGDAANVGFTLPGIATRVWVAHREDPACLVPIGAVGELLIEGPNLARGYLNDSSKTAASFINAHRFVTQRKDELTDPRRVYRTGDLVRYKSDGSLLLLGRNDSQVKIRGQRVDLAEVEHFIQALSTEVQSAVVDYVACDQHQPILIAAVELHDKSGTNLQAISDLLKAQLPDKLPSYMIPRHYILLDRFPRTISGKTDRRAICKIMLDEQARIMYRDPGATVQSASRVSSKKESLIRELWAKILTLDAASIDSGDSFLDLGADSIGAMKLVAMGKLQGLEMKVFDIFKNPVLRDLAKIAREVVAQDTQSPSRQLHRPFQLLEGVEDLPTFLKKVICPVAMRPPEAIHDVFPTTDAVALCVVGALTSAQVEVHTFALDFTGKPDLERLQRCCSLLTQHIEAFRTVFVLDVDKGELLQVILKSFQHHVQTVKAQGCFETATRNYLEQRMTRTFKLGLPMVDMVIIHEDQTNQTRLLIRLSHALYDGLSLPILYQTLKQLYDQESVIDHQLNSYAAYVRELAPHKTIEAYQFWRDLLSGSAMTTLSEAREVHNPSPSRMRFEGRMVVPGGRTWGEGITTSTIIAVAWAHVLALHTGQDDVVFGDSISGTNLVDPDIASSVMGCRATHVPVRLQLDRSGKQTLLMLLHQLRDQTQNRIPHEGVGFSTIIRECTDWAPSTRFTSIVNHRPGSLSPRASDSGGLDFSAHVLEPSEEPLRTWYDVAVLSQETEGGVEIALGYSDDAIARGIATALFQDLVSYVDYIMKTSVDWARESTLHGSGIIRRHSFTYHHPMWVSEYRPNDIVADGNGSNSATSVGIDSTLEDVWWSLFSSDSLTSTSDAPMEETQSHAPCEMPFYELRGTLLNALHLVTLIEQRRVRGQSTNISNDTGKPHCVKIDDLFRNPSLKQFDTFLKQNAITMT